MHIVPYGRKFWREYILQIAEIMTFGGIYFDGWGEVLAIMIFIAKWLIEPGHELVSVNRTTPTQKHAEKKLPIFLGKWPTTIPASAFTATAYTSFELPSSRWQANSSPASIVKTLWRRDVLIWNCQWWTPCRRLHHRYRRNLLDLWLHWLARPAAGLLYRLKLSLA